MNTNTLQCLIVEDEPLAAEVLRDYIEQVPQLQLVASCQDAIFALEYLQTHPIDLMFLDIHLPKIKGLDFIRTLQHPPHIILTTAYHQYALDGFELDVVDYLLKPIEFSRFLKAVNKVIPKGNPTIPSPSFSKENRNRPYRFFNTNKKHVKVYLDEILYIESLKEYVRIITHKSQIITKFQIGEIKQELDDPNLIRIHRSYLVALDKIDAFSAYTIDIKGKELPIGKTYKEEVLARLKNGNIG